MELCQNRETNIDCRTGIHILAFLPLLYPVASLAPRPLQIDRADSSPPATPLLPLLPQPLPPPSHADHADALTTYITENYLFASLPDERASAANPYDDDDGNEEEDGFGFSSLGGSPAGGATTAVPRDGQPGLASPSRGAVLKGQALKALARALAPSSVVDAAAGGGGGGGEMALPERVKSVVAPFVKVGGGEGEASGLKGAGRWRGQGRGG